MDNISPRYFDGTSSQAQLAKLQLTDQSLIITLPNQIPVIWAYQNIYVKEDWQDLTGAILGYKGDDDVSLSIYERCTFLNLQKRLSQRSRASFIIPTQYRHLFLMMILAVASVVILFPLLGQMASLVTHLIPHTLEKKLGDMIMEDMRKELHPCEDNVAKANLDKIVSRLYEASGEKEIKPEIQFFKSSASNAYSLPGGHMAILTQFLVEARSENEIAAVIAHEMGHLARRDSLEAYVESQGFSLLTNLIGSSGSYGGLAEVATLMQTLSYSRQKELAADMYGAKLLIKAGYSPQGMVSFLSNNDHKQAGILPESIENLNILSTHPETKERIKRIQELGGSSHYRPSLTISELKRLKLVCQVTSQDR